MEENPIEELKQKTGREDDSDDTLDQNSNNDGALHLLSPDESEETIEVKHKKEPENKLKPGKNLKPNSSIKPEEVISIQLLALQKNSKVCNLMA